MCLCSAYFHQMLTCLFAYSESKLTCHFVLVVVVVLVLVHVVAVIPRTQPLKFGQDRISNI